MLLINVTQGTEGTPLPPQSNFLFYNISPTKTIYTPLDIWSKIFMALNISFPNFDACIFIFYTKAHSIYGQFQQQVFIWNRLKSIFLICSISALGHPLIGFKPDLLHIFPFIFGFRISWRFLYWISPIFRCEFVEEGLAGEHLTHHWSSQTAPIITGPTWWKKKDYITERKVVTGYRRNLELQNVCTIWCFFLGKGRQKEKVLAVEHLTHQ